MKNLLKRLGILALGAGLTINSYAQDLSKMNNFLIPFQDNEKGNLIYDGKDLKQVDGSYLNGYVKYKEDIPYTNAQGKKDSFNMLFFYQLGSEEMSWVFIDTHDKINLSEKISGKADYKFDKVEHIMRCGAESGKIIPKKFIVENPSHQNYSNLYRSIISVIQMADDRKSGRGTVLEGKYISD